MLDLLHCRPEKECLSPLLVVDNAVNSWSPSLQRIPDEDDMFHGMDVVRTEEQQPVGGDGGGLTGTPGRGERCRRPAKAQWGKDERLEALPICLPEPYLGRGEGEGSLYLPLNLSIPRPS